MEKYKISQVAKKFEITRTTLIHYDNSGLLSPSIRNDKNYRYYTSDDILKLELILALRESGLSLKEIKSYLSEESDLTSIELLSQQEHELDKKIEFLERQRNIIKKRVENLEKFKGLDIYEGVRLDRYPKMIIIKEVVGYGPLMNYDSAVSRLRKKLEEEGQLSSKFGICYDISHHDSHGKYSMKYIFDYLNTDEYSKEKSSIEGSSFIRSLHRGKYTTVEDTVNKLLEHAKEMNYIISAHAYFIPLFDYWESLSDDFIGEVLIPIEDI